MILTKALTDRQYYLNEAFIVSVMADTNKVETLYTVELANGKTITTNDERFAAYLKP
jgi:hypothetical protein